jgi:hypothetical protein
MKKAKPSIIILGRKTSFKIHKPVPVLIAIIDITERISG